MVGVNERTSVLMSAFAGADRKRSTRGQIDANGTKRTSSDVRCPVVNGGRPDDVGDSQFRSRMNTQQIPDARQSVDRPRECLTFRLAYVCEVDILPTLWARDIEP